MADNVPISAGAGTNIATDQLAGGEHVQFIKIMDGTLDGTSKAAVGANGLSADVKASVLPTGAATETTLGSRLSESGFDTKTGSLTETAPATDTASSGLNGRLQRIAQRITSLIALLPSALTGSGNLKAALVESTATVTVTGTVTANAGTGTLGTQDSSSLVDNAAFTDGTSRVLPSGYIFDETAGTALTENDVAASRIDSKRAAIIALEDATTRGQRLTISAAGAAKVDGSAATQPVSAASLPLPTGAATETTLGTRLSETDFDTKTGVLTETAPTTDTASSGLNGRLQRIAQRITSLIALVPTALTGGGNFKAALVESTATVTVTAVIDTVANAPSTVSVGVSSASAVAANASRKGLILRNTSTSGQRISLGFDGAAAVLDSGIVLYPQDVFAMAAFDFTNGAVTAIANAASGSLSIQEYQ